MKYLKKFNESDALSDIKDTCKDILLELSDKGVEYKIYEYKGSSLHHTHTKDKWRDSKDIIRVEIGNGTDIVKLKEFESEFSHLFSYLKEEGFELGGNSYFENNSWEYYESCPNCDSESVSSPDDLKSMRGWSCNKCKHIGHQDDFQKPEHPIKESDLIWAIKQNYYINFMVLDFISVK
jgi:hypothetical protein